MFLNHFCQKFGFFFPVSSLTSHVEFISLLWGFGQQNLDVGYCGSSPHQPLSPRLLWQLSNQASASAWLVTASFTQLHSASGSFNASKLLGWLEWTVYKTRWVTIGVSLEALLVSCTSLDHSVIFYRKKIPFDL